LGTLVGQGLAAAETWPLDGAADGHADGAGDGKAPANARTAMPRIVIISIWYTTWTGCQIVYTVV
jgi:hypothetical protein